MIQKIKKKNHDYYAKVVTRNPKARWSEINKLVKPKDFDHVFPNKKLDQVNETFAKVLQLKSTIDSINLTNSSPLQYN